MTSAESAAELPSTLRTVVGDTPLLTAAAIFGAGVLLAYVPKAVLNTVFTWWTGGLLMRVQVDMSSTILRRFLRALYALHVRTNSADILGTVNDAVAKVYGSPDALPPAPAARHGRGDLGAGQPHRTADHRHGQRPEGRRGLPVRAIGRDWSQHPLDRIRTWDLRRPDVPAGRDVGRATRYGLVAGAAANLNMHHDQDGFRMRTFEIPGAGGLQLIDRDDVAGYYDPGSEVLVYRDFDQACELATRALSDRPWPRSIARAGRRRTLAEHTLDHRVHQLEAVWTA